MTKKTYEYVVLSKITDKNTPAKLKNIFYNLQKGQTISTKSIFKILKLLNYETISDYEVSQNPKIVDGYDKIILLHNEYVTKKCLMQ